MVDKVKVEKTLKSYLKKSKSFSFSMGLLVSFLITGSFGYAETIDEIMPKDKEKEIVKVWDSSWQFGIGRTYWGKIKNKGKNNKLDSETYSTFIKRGNVFERNILAGRTEGSGLVGGEKTSISDKSITPDRESTRPDTVWKKAKVDVVENTTLTLGDSETGTKDNSVLSMRKVASPKDA